jgi:hypothetical protein
MTMMTLANTIRQRVFGAAFAVLLLSGCTSLEPLPLRPTAMTAPGDPISIFWLHAYQAGEGVRVVGNIRPRNGVYRTGRGHLDVTATLADASEARTIATRPGPLPRRGKGTRSFSVFFGNVDHRNVVQLAVRYHEGAPHMAAVA